MTLADVIILIIVGLIIGGIIFQMVRTKDKKACKTCSYSKNIIKK